MKASLGNLAQYLPGTVSSVVSLFSVFKLVLLVLVVVVCSHKAVYAQMLFGCM